MYVAVRRNDSVNSGVRSMMGAKLWPARVWDVVAWRCASCRRRGFSSGACAAPCSPILMNPSCKVAVVVGGCEGIGLAAATQLLAARARHVALIGIDTCKGKNAVNGLNSAYGKNKSMFLNCNVHCKIQLGEAWKIINKEFGQVEIVVNSAGSVNGSQWEKELQTNLAGCVRTTLAAYNGMTKEGEAGILGCDKPEVVGGSGGVIINVSGTHALEGLPAGPTLAANLAGIVAFSRSLGHLDNYQRSGVRIVTLCVGVTKTNFITGLDRKGLNRCLGSELQSEFCKRAKRQKSEVCAKAIHHLIQFAHTNTLWAVEGSKLYQLDIPDWRRCTKLVAQYL